MIASMKMLSFRKDSPLTILSVRARGLRSPRRRRLPPLRLRELPRLLRRAGVALAPAAVAAVLLSTSPVFSLFIDRWIYKTPLRPAAVVGTLTAVAGVAVLTSG